ncbi:MAG: hypothetical protein ACLFV6_06805 [Spirulinaceae cyanobacterium]
MNWKQVCSGILLGSLASLIGLLSPILELFQFGRSRNRPFRSCSWQNYQLLKNTIMNWKQLCSGILLGSLASLKGRLITV